MNGSSVLGAIDLQIAYGFHPKEVHLPSSKMCWYCTGYTGLYSIFAVLSSIRLWYGISSSPQS